MTDFPVTWWVRTLSDILLNDSDKSFIVPATNQYQILWIWVELTTTATAGDRRLVIEVQDAAGDVIAQLARSDAVQAASLTRYYLFAPVTGSGAFFDTDYIQVAIPPTAFLDGGQTLRVYDENAVDAAADDMVVKVQIADRAAVT